MALIVLELGKNKRELVIVKYMDIAVFGVNDRHRLAPVALAGEDPLAEMIVDGALRNAHLFKLNGNGFLGFLNGHSGEFLGVDELVALAEIILFLERVTAYVDMSVLFIAVDYLEHIDIVRDRVLKVTLVM